MTTPLTPDQLSQLLAAVQAQLGPPSIGEGFPNPVAQLFQAGNTTLITPAGLFIYNGTPANGNLIISLAPASGADAFGNAYPQGLGISAGAIPGSLINAGTVGLSQLAVGIVYAGIVNATTITGSTLENSASNPATSINPSGSITITNSAGVVIFEIGPDGTHYWYSSTGVLLMEFQPGGTALIYASGTGPALWDFEGGSTDSWAANSCAISNSSAWAANGSESLAMTANGSNPWGATSPAVVVVAGTTFTAECFVYAPAALSAVSVGVTFWSGAGGGGSSLGSVVGDQGVFPMSPGQVTQFTITGAAVPPAAVSATFYVREAAADVSGTLLYIDFVNIAGGLAYSNSPTGGTDAFGNVFEQGINFVGLANLTNVLGVEDPYGNQLAVITGQGNINAQTISATTDMLIGGQSLTTEIAGSAQGLVNYGYITANPWPATPMNAATAALFELDASVVPGRIYEFVMYPTTIRGSVAGMTVALALHYTVDGSTPTVSSATATYIGKVLSAANTPDEHPGLRCVFFTVSGNAQLRCLVGGLANMSGTYYFTQDPFIRCVINDLGANDAGQSSNNMNVIATGGTGGSGGGTSQQNYTEVFYPSKTWSYRTDGGLRNTNGSMFHGAYPGEPGYQYSYIQWGTGSLGHNLNTVLGYTVNYVTLRLTNLHSWYDSGMTFGVHSSTSLGGGVGTYSTLLTSQFISEGNTYAYTLGSGAWSPFAAGGTTYMVLGPDAGDESNLGWYGYFYGGGGSAGQMPKLTVNFTH